MGILGQLNQSYAIDDMVCIKDIRTDRDLKRANQDGYPVGFTRSTWRKQFPSIPPKHVWCRKSEGMFPQGLLYYDKENYICFEMQIYGAMVMPPPNAKGRTPDEVFAQHIARMMELRKEKHWKRLVIPNFSEGSGLLVMQLIKDIMDHEEHSGEIYDLFIDFYTMCDAGSSLVTPEVIERLLACKTDAQKQETEKALEHLPELVTVYRGNASESTHYEKACSWTTDINVAYFFASWRDASESCVFEGKVKKSDIIEYVDGRNESEVIVKPDSVTDVKKSPCVKWSDFVSQNNSTTLPFGKTDTYEKFTMQTITREVDDIYEGLDGSLHDHDMAHTKRVCMMANYLFRVLTRGRKEKAQALWDALQNLMDAAMWHDTGRTDDSIDVQHGYESTLIYQREFSENPVAEFLMEYHCKPDADARAFMEENFEKCDWPLIWMDHQILKDADALDRWRFGRLCEDFIDVKYLRIDEAKALMPVAAYLQKATE